MADAGVQADASGPVDAPGPSLAEAAVAPSSTVPDGVWYTYSDRTILNSAPPIVIHGVPGMLTPMEGAQLLPSTNSKGPGSIGSSGAPTPLPYYEVSGGGETLWGAGEGVDLVTALPDGGPVAFNSCPNDAGVAQVFDTSGASPGVHLALPFDAAAAGYTGLSFFGTSFAAAPVSITVQLDDARTSPWGRQCAVCPNGGKCAVDSDGGEACPCSDSYLYSAFLPAATWKQFSFHWTDRSLAPANWSGQGLPKGGLDATSLYSIRFQLTVIGGKALPPFDIGVAGVTWLSD